KAPQYISADAASLEDMKQAYNKIKESHSQIDGVIHSAIVFNEENIKDMTEEGFRNGLSAKIDVSIRIAQIFNKEKLDFVLFFSSLISYIKNPKQSHYAAGCTFEDAFAHQLSKIWTSPVKVINWGYWGEHEMDDRFLQHIHKVGLDLIDSKEGMKALDILLTGPINQIGMIKTNKPIAVEGMNTEEVIDIYNNDFSVDMNSLQKGIKEIELCIKPDNYITSKELNHRICRVLLGQLQSVGLLEHDRLDKNKVNQLCINKYSRWLEQSIEFLQSANFIKDTGDCYEVIKSGMVDVDNMWNEWEKVKASWLQDRSMKAWITLLETTLKKLPEIITGKVPATDIMFPNSSMELVENIYKNNQVADYFNEVLADAVVEYIKQYNKKSADIRILEIGAGTGGTSSMVFNKIRQYKEYIQEYCYTDISKSFLLHAEKEYGPDNPYIAYKIYDLEKSPEQQNIDLDHYDIVIAANVLHATKDIAKSLRNVKKILRKDGLLILNEMVGNSLTAHLTFGLLEGWWLNEDTEIRIKGCPGLYSENWQDVLEKEGYESVFFPAKNKVEFGQQIIVSKSNGVVRKKVSIDRCIESKNTVTIELPKKNTNDRLNTDNNNDEKLREKSTEYIKQLIGQTLKIDINKLDTNEQFEKYGIDSILVIELTNSLRKVFDNISSTIFFEYITIDDLVEHLIITQKNSLIKLVGLDKIENNNNQKQYGQSINNDSLRKPRTFIKTNESVSTKEKNDSEYEVEDIAVIGISGRYPKARNLNEFWNNLKNGENCISEIPSNRWDWKDHYDEKKGKKGIMYTRWAGFMEDIDKFDPLFFNISPREAERMDPQERLFLEIAYESIEDAGYTPENISTSRKVGVFAGVMNGYYPGGHSFSSIANRVSYIFNFQGPSMALDTACSSSLTALHLALESLYSGSIECAIAGGVNLIMHPNHLIRRSEMTMLSEGNECKVFGVGADGFVDGEGVGAVILKPLKKAKEDGDHIYGIIKGSMINTAGKTNGYTVPNPAVQSQLITEALKRAKVNAREISYLEAHGTGTILGDPIEVKGATSAFEEDTKERQFCSIGSVKSNIGHCESAAGVAGLTKLLLQLKYKQLVPSIHSKELNPNIDFDNSPFYVQQELQEWKRPIINIDGVEKECSRIAGLSAFGAGGSNAHIVLEEYITNNELEISYSIMNPVIILLSAKNEEGLCGRVKRLLTAVEQSNYTDKDLMKISYTLQTGRQAMYQRLGLMVTSIQELKEKLMMFLNDEGYMDGLYRGRAKSDKEILSIFGDEDIQTTIDAWIKKDKYQQLVKLWVKGLDIDWNRLYDENKPRRISLPTYPFAKESYWVKETNCIPIKNDTHKNLYNTKTEVKYYQEDYQLMTFEEVWKEERINQSEFQNIDKVICFVSGEEYKQNIVETLHEKNNKAKIIFISKGDQYSKESSDNYRISANNNNDYIEAFNNIKDNYGEIDTILYLWALEDSSCITDYSPIVYILQGINSVGLRISKILLAGEFTNDLDRCYLESWVSFERSMGLIMPDTRISAIIKKTEKELSRVNIKDWINRLYEELSITEIKSALYIEDKRYIHKFQQMTLESKMSVLKENGTYLITGGCGGLGYMFAKHIAKKHPVNLILVGRSPMDNEKESMLKQLEELGSRVVYIQGDISDQILMKKELDYVKQEFGAINGVIHAAGIIGNESIFKKSIAKFNDIVKPKINGTMVLDELIENETLDFMCYFSSSSAILGDFGSCDYSIANRFQMAYAHHRNRKYNKKNTYVINWPLWKDGGMGFDSDENSNSYLKLSGQHYLESKEGIQAFESIIAQNKTQHMVLVGKPSRVLNFLKIDNDEQHNQKPKLNTFSNIERQEEVEEPSIKDYLEKDLKGYIGEVLKISEDRLEIDKDLADFGFDSVSMTELASLLTEHYGLNITPSLFFEYSNIEKLINYFQGEHKSLIEEFYKKNTVKPSILTYVTYGEETEKFETVNTINNKMETDANLKPNPNLEPIAIIGMSGRFPNARTIDEMWTIIENGQEVISEIPKDRFDWTQYYGNPIKEKDKTDCKWCGSMPGIWEFDSAFFEITPQEAKKMDPRQRILLQESWKALEDAGYGDEKLNSNKVGMYVGVEEGDYHKLSEEMSNITSNHNGILAARLSYFLDFNGPNMAINTACSSGLVALHQACMSLRNGECDTAIAAGASMIFTPDGFLAMSKIGMISNTGKCYAFDKRADGMVPGEAVAAVVIKKLSKAKEDNDPIYAVIKGTGINYDGKTNGITAPNGAAQSELMKSVYEKYNINPDNIGYIVTHGTGTRLGDSVEINSMCKAFKNYTDKEGYCAITSNKTNFGHTGATSGLLSLINLVESINHGVIPASLNCQQENDYTDWSHNPFYVNKHNRPWDLINGRRTGAVSAFGMSGTNAHVVLENYEDEIVSVSEKMPYHLLVFSAKTREALEQKITDMIEMLTEKDISNSDLSNISYTLLVGRQHFNHRCGVIVRDNNEAVSLLRDVLNNKTNQNVFEGTTSRRFQGKKEDYDYGEKLLKESSIQKDNEKHFETLSLLADLYCKGYKLDWKQLFGHNSKSMHLPTYPFIRKTYRISENINKNDIYEPKNNKIMGEQLKMKQEITGKPKNVALNSVVTTKYIPVETDNKNEYVSVKTLQKELVTSLSKLLQVDASDIDADAKFIDMGVDSISGVEWINILNNNYQTTITATKIYDYPTIREFSSYLKQELNINISPSKEDSHEKQHIALQSLSQFTIKDNNTKNNNTKNSPNIDSSIKNISLDSTTKAVVNLNPIKTNDTATLQKELVISLSELLQVDASDIDVDTKFIEMGVDSISGVEWIKGLNEKYQTLISATKIYDYPTINEFAIFLGSKMNSLEVPVVKSLAEVREDKNIISNHDIDNDISENVIDISEIEPGIVLIKMQDYVNKNTFTE
ncbi:SDR family NAD(P)-dependent oxidoreductase, partial [Vallitalea guaymasensis]|uniref:SDR family NAD(P)-dependent oxidoreductase n=1 Tax=Vallitalea guaymasensis TaxID=1185412 RepID=UPI00272D0DD4